MVTKALRTMVLLLSMVVLFAAPQHQAQAVSLTNCTRDGLAAAIAANPGGTITFEACPSQQINITSVIRVNNDITLDGGGRMALDGGDTSGILDVAAVANLTLNNIILQNGQTSFSGIDDAAIRRVDSTSTGTITIIGSTFRSNNGANGGAIHNGGGRMVITSSRFTDNISGVGGSIYNAASGAIEITDSEFISNSVAGLAGAIYNSGVLTTTNTGYMGNSGASNGGAILNAAGADLQVVGGVFHDNTATTSGAAISNSGNATIAAATFTNNISNSRGGGVANNGILVVTGSIFTENVALPGFGFGGGIHNGSGGEITVRNTKFYGNSPTGISNPDGTGTVNNNCFVGNLIGVNDAAGALTSVSENFWGSLDGPSGLGSGTGDAILGNSNFAPILTTPGFADQDCPTVVTDLYTADVNEPLIIGADRGVLNNDLAVLDGSVVPRTVTSPDTVNGPEFGDLELRADGSFTYTPTDTTRPFDGFRYTATPIGGGTVIGLVCITRTNLQLIVPPTQTTQPGATIPVPGIRVNSSPGANITVDLSVQLGTLSTPFGNTIPGTPPAPADVCRSLLTDLRTVSLPDAPEVVQDDTTDGYGIEMMSGGRGNFVPYFQPAGVSIQGSGTDRMQVIGPENGVNQVLATLEYTAPNLTGTDQIEIIATDDAGGVAVGQVVIIIGTQSGESVLAGNNTAAEIVVQPQPPPIPLGPSTLFEISQFENTVINGESTVTTVTDGDVWVRVLATNGELIDPGAIGDPFLLEQAIFNSADVYGLTVGGSTVTNFNLTVLVCLRGQGTFYFRDAATSPRTTRVLPSTFDGVFTCAFIPNAGTVVLVGRRADAQLADNTALFELDAATLPEGCMVTTDDIINLREGPGMDDEIIRRIPFDVTLTAFEQSGQWYFVDYLGLRGWMSADFVTPNDFC
ncbi:MAG: SH3 domain-containing protein [Chloroflexota bacterium]